MYSAKWLLVTLLTSLTTLSLILFPLVATSQESPKGSTTAKKEVVWKEFKSKTGEYLAEFPGDAKEIEIKAAAGRISVFASMTYGKSVQISLRVDEQPQKLNDPKLLETVGVQSLARLAAKKKDIKIGDYPGIEFSFERQLGAINRRTISRVFAIEGRIYQMSIQSDSSEVVPEEIIARYFDSFRLIYNVAKPTLYERKDADHSATPKSESSPNSTPKLPITEEFKLVDAVFEPGKPTLDPKLADVERTWLDTLRKLPRTEYQYRENLCQLRGSDSPQGFAFSPDGKLFATAGGKELVIRELATNRIVSVFPGFDRLSDKRLGFRFSADGKLLVSTCVEYTRIGDRIQFGSEKYSIRIIDIKTGALLRKVPTSKPAHDCALSSDGSILTAVFNQFDTGEKFAVWNTKDWIRKPIPFPLSGNFTWAFSPDGNHLFVSPIINFPKSDNLPPIQAWNLTKGTRSLFPTKLVVRALQAHTDGRSLLVTTDKNTDSNMLHEYHMIDFATGADRKITESPYSSYPAVLSPDGKYFLISSVIGNMGYHTKLLDANTGHELWSLDKSNSNEFMISSGGTLLFRQYFYRDSRDSELFSLDDMIKPGWVRLAGAINKARDIGFEIFPYGKTLRAKTREKNFNSESFAKLAKLLPETTVVELNEIERFKFDLSKGIKDLSKLPNLEQVDVRMTMGKDKEFFKALTSLSQVRRLRLQDGDFATETLKDMENLEELVFDTTFDVIEKDGFKNILGAKKLRTLEISTRVSVDDDTFKGIKSLTELRSFKSRYTNNLTSAVCNDLLSCPKLETLDILLQHSNDAHLESLSKLDSLKELTIRIESSRESIFNDNSLIKLNSAIKKVRNLQILGQTQITEKGIEKIDPDQLEKLSLDGVMFTDEMLRVLNRFTKLQELSIIGGNYVGDGFNKLNNLKNLRILRISGRENISRTKIAELQKLLPNTLIEQSF